MDQIEGPVDQFLADGAYDGSSTRDLLVKRFDTLPEVAIPPPKNANFSPNMAQDPTLRDHQIAHIKTQMGRWKAVIGPKLKARCFANQKTEAYIGVRALNRMTGPGRPSFERTA